MEQANSAAPWPFPTSGPNLEAALKASLEAFKEEERKVKYVHIQRGYGGFGYTFAYRPVLQGRKSVFVEVAVATCSSKDMFNRSLGRSVAKLRLDKGECMRLPLGIDGLSQVPSYLHGMFGYV